jgi:hypothetical protein
MKCLFHGSLWPVDGIAFLISQEVKVESLRLPFQRPESDDLHVEDRHSVVMILLGRRELGYASI